MAEIISGHPLDICRYLMQVDIDPNSMWDLCKHKEKRSLSSNRYYWQLLEKIAVKLHEPKAKLHNINLRHLGLVQRVGDKPCFILLPDNEQVENDILNASTFHLAPRNEIKVGTDGIVYRWYVMLRGSSSFSVSEMQALVDFAVQDAKSLGIETIPTNELEYIKKMERENEERRSRNMEKNT